MTKTTTEDRISLRRDQEAYGSRKQGQEFSEEFQQWFDENYNWGRIGRPATWRR